MDAVAAQLDRPDTPPRRWALWLPMLLWIFIMTTFAAFRGRSFSELFEAGGFDAQVKFQAAAWVGLGCLALGLLAKGRADLRLLRRGPMFWYGCFVATALLSTIYSPQPAYTAYRSLQHAVAIVLVISLRQHLRGVYLFIAAFVAVNWALVVLGLLGLNFGTQWISNPAESMAVTAGFEKVWRFESAFGHPSLISVVAAAGAAGLAYRARGRQWLVAGPLMGWLVLTTVVTISRTAIAGLAGGLIVAAVGRRVLIPCICLVGFVAPILLMSTDVREASGYYLSRGQDDADFRSLTGRVQAYQEAVRRIKLYWPIGQGFQAGRVQSLDATGENYAVSHAHNLFLESAFSLGLLGIVFATMVLIALAATVWRILQRDRALSGEAYSVGWELAAMAVPMGAFCILDSGFVAKMDHVGMLFLVVIAQAQTQWLDADESLSGEEAIGGASCPT